MDNLPPILLTSSVIAMDQSVHLKDEKLRIFHTLESIKKWLDISPKNKYVLCDGSGFDFSSLVAEHFPNANIECLSFNNDPALIKIHGKGFGEGEIIRYALEHSEILSESQWFSKCTAKLWVDNFLECTAEWNGKFLCQVFFSNAFSLKRSKPEYIDTRFYIADTNFYKAYLAHAHIDIGGVSGISIEDRFLEIAMREHLSGFIFKNPPVVCGVGGGSGKYYKDSRIRRVKERLRSWVISRNEKFETLFNRP
ncbi:hypothetical protein [Polynucleobacter sp. 80A-SIGWE]|uniref:hypothetical protein n=1 Tax=Polynucleobacter sp. 80A-SIGWE TaxID=2689100 RepID=UPI001C0DDA5A|nr:hypothetical protein [Polynucleobacter sp. 80A-SIGWE]MBU3589018.1 hypothetical protein [Polynucleobacter sp. 80A-SIGWE]